MPDIDPFATELAALPAPIHAAVQKASLPGLSDGPQDENLGQVLGNSSKLNDWGDLSGRQQQLCLSGLWLLAGELDLSHDISQGIGSAEGSFWHGVMHRREGDFSNAKYWFRRVGEHPVFDRVEDLSEGNFTDPFEFVDACSRAKEGTSAYEDCQLTQWLEWQAMMCHCLSNG